MIKRYFILLAFIASLLFSCKKDIPIPDPDPEPDPEPISNEYVNSWIYDEMSVFYLWNRYIPTPRRLDFESHPEVFFESILYKRDMIDGDRFSWIQEDFVDLLNSLQGVTQYDIGYEYVGYLIDDKTREIVGQIVYVKQGTDAEAVGLKRGDLFTKVNGITLNTTNWRSLLSNSETSATITFVDINTSATTNKTVRKIANYAEDPVFFDKVYEVNGHKIGYLVYNFFASGPTNKDFTYDKKLNDAFGRFKSKGITELVLDLRYNSGGSMNSATLLGSMIAPDFNTNNIFTKLEYNSLIQEVLINEYGKDALVDNMRDKLETGEAINNVGNTIKSLYVLTGRWTASASEMVINGLKPYMNGKPIILIGDITVGKNVGSITLFEEDDPDNKWGMQPIVCRYFNKDGNADFLNGFAPDFVEKDNFLDDKLPLGDLNERMLKIAIEHINTGNFPPLSRSGISGRITVGSSVEQRAWAGKTIIDNSLLKDLNIER